MRAGFLGKGWGLGLLLGWAAVAAHGQAMPSAIAGTWRIVKILPTTTNVQCWGGDQANALVNTTVTYRSGAMVWKGGPYAVTDVLTRTLSRRRFADEYKVDLAQLGINAVAVTEYDLQHEDADITGATTEVPGDTVVVAGPGRIVVSACGVFYAAVRVTGKSGGGH